MGDLVDFLTQNEEGFRKARLPALYSDFRGLRTINPDGYTANVSAWRRAIASITRSGRAPSRASAPNLFIFSADEQLLRALESKQYGRPLALGSVVREAALEKDLVPLQDFLKAKESIYQKSWSSLPWNVVSWGLRQLGLTGGLGSGDDKLPGGQFVVLANVEEASRAFDEKTADYSSRLQRTWSAAHFKRSFADSIFSSQRLSDADMDVFLRFLSRDKGLILYNGKTIRVKAPDDEQMAITSEDEAIAQLKELTAYLSHQTSLLNKRIEELTAAAKDAVLRKNKVAALAALKSKKIAESSLQTRFATLSQLEEVAAKIEHAADNVALVRVMSSSTDVLKSLNAQVGGVDRVEDVVDKLREQMGAVDEIGSILAESGSVVDEGEIDDELEALQREEQQKEDEARKAKAEAERTQREADQAEEAETTRKRLEAIEAPTSPPDKQQALNVPDAAAAETVEGLSRMSLEERPQMEPAI